MEKLKICKIEIKNILCDYDNGMSIRKIAKKYNHSFSYVQKLIHSNNHEKKIKLNYPKINNHEIIAVCKITKKEFKDYKNISGAITTHVSSTYNIKLPSKYKRKIIEYNSGKFWYDKYFYFIQRKVSKKKKCMYCDWDTNDINNSSGAYEKHLKNKHNINLIEYVKEYPNEKQYFKKECYENLIECKICGKEFKYITNTHLKKHNTTQLEYKIKYGGLIISKTTKNKLKENYELYLKNKPFKKSSSLEKFISDNIPIKPIKSNRKILNGKEIDLIYNNIGFEINGLIYHTENFGKKDKNYHINKTKTALNNNVNLYHIFEDEIILKPEITISKVLHILNLNNNPKRIHARKCEITENITKTQKSIFLNENHIQGNDRSSIIICAKHNDEIIAIMTFDNKRSMNKKINLPNEYELTRFAIKNKIIVNGIGSRLIKHFIKKYKPTKIISFADRRWTPDKDNNLYIKLGFKLTKTYQPDYWYYNPKIDRNKRFHKFGFGKNSLKKRFPDIYDPNKTEWEMMQELEYDRIWDCGKLRYELTL